MHKFHTRQIPSAACYIRNNDFEQGRMLQFHRKKEDHPEGSEKEGKEGAPG